MAATKDCGACKKLRDKSSELITNGVTSTICTNLKNNKGVALDDGAGDCTDLDQMNDCLIGNMEDELNAYEVCDWKRYMHKFIRNLWNMLRAMICAICGIWTHINTILCYIDFLINGKSVRFTEDDFIAGTDVVFEGTSDLALAIKGTTYRFNGSAQFKMSNDHWKHLGFTNTGARQSYTEGGETKYYRLNTHDGNYTIAVLKIKKSDYPWLSNLRSTTGTFMNAGLGQIAVNVYNGDSDDSKVNSYPPQWGNPSGDRIRVPAGYLYVRISLIGITTWGGGTSDTVKQVTMSATGMADISQAGLDCD